jgi:hypothetical protein
MFVAKTSPGLINVPLSSSGNVRWRNSDSVTSNDYGENAGRTTVQRFIMNCGGVLVIPKSTMLWPVQRYILRLSLTWLSWMVCNKPLYYIWVHTIMLLILCEQNQKTWSCNNDMKEGDSTKKFTSHVVQHWGQISIKLSRDCISHLKEDWGSDGKEEKGNTIYGSMMMIIWMGSDYVSELRPPTVHPPGDIWPWRTMMEWCLQRKTPDSSTRALWQSCQQSSGSKQEGGREYWIWPCEVFLFILAIFYVLWNLTKWGLQIYFHYEGRHAADLYCTWKSITSDSLSLWTLGLIAGTLTIMPLRRLIYGLLIVYVSSFHKLEYITVVEYYKCKEVYNSWCEM